MKYTISNRAKALCNFLLLLLLMLAVVYFSGLPIPIPKIQFRFEERAHLIGPGNILSIEEIDFSYFETMIVAETDEGVILWVSAPEIDRSDLVYQEKTGDNLLLAAPGSLGFMTVTDKVHLPLVLFDRHPRATHAEMQFTLQEEVDGVFFEKAYCLSADRTASGFFLFTLNTDNSYTYPEAVTLQIFANIASCREHQQNYSVPVQIQFYNGRGELIIEETVIVSGD